MHSRKEQQAAGIELPASWRETVTELLYSTYEEQCIKSNRSFEVFGQTFPDEVFLAISLLDQNDQAAIPVTCSLSSDLSSTDKSDKIIETLIDSVGMIFDDYFSSENWDEFTPIWTDIEFKGIKIYYKITRENVALSLLADKLLMPED
jgi:hypothetical protein